MKHYRNFLALLLAALLLTGCDADLSALYDDAEAILGGKGGTSRLMSVNTLLNDTLNSSAAKASGIFDVWYCREQVTVSFDITLEVTEGRAKLVYVEKESGEMIALAESTGGTVTYTGTIQVEGRADIRLVCDAAAYKLEMTASGGRLTTP